MRHYEIIFLIHPDQSEQVQSMIERYEAILTKNHGKIHRKEDWGRRQLAYSINDLHKAHYILLNVECDQEALDEFKNSCKYNDAILRHLILKKSSAIVDKSILFKKENIVA